jgi:hypothetical protein
MRRDGLTRRVTGGERGFRAAVKNALYGDGRSMHSPAVHWTAANGFYVCPSEHLTPMNAGEVEVWRANLCANTGKPYCLPDYAAVREMCQ